jgi:hypothetical protein
VDLENPTRQILPPPDISTQFLLPSRLIAHTPNSVQTLWYYLNILFHPLKKKDKRLASFLENTIYEASQDREPTGEL